MHEKDITVLIPDEIEKKIETNEYSIVGSVVRDNKGCIVKQLPERVRKSQNTIPQSFIQINHNYAIVDNFQKTINLMKQIKFLDRSEKLEEQYSQVFNLLSSINMDKSLATDLFKKCLDAISIFDVTLLKNAEMLNLDKIEKESDKFDVFLDSVNAYLRVMYVYLYSTFLCYGEKSTDESVILKNINSLESKLQSIYQYILLPIKGKYAYFDEGVYSLLILNSNFDAKLLEEVVYFDNRHDTVSSLLHYLKTNNFLKRQDLSGSTRYYYDIPNEYEKSTDCVAHKVIKGLVDIFYDIDHLKKIRTEFDNPKLDKNLSIKLMKSIEFQSK